MNNIVAFLPMRRGSERVPNKNTRNFSGIEDGLTFIKISQLLKVKRIYKIIISTNDDKVKKIANSFNNNKIVIIDRAEELSSSNTSTDELIKYVPTIVSSNFILWTHTTSPFIDENTYDDMIDKFFQNIDKFDSLMSVTMIQKFLWDDNGPINDDRKIEKWPRTQTIKPIYEVNSGAFIASIDVYKYLKDRIGLNPFLYKLDGKQSFDIDWEDDFDMAEILWSKYGKL